MPRARHPVPTLNQLRTARLIKAKLDAGELWCRELITDAHIEVYGITANQKTGKSARQVASSYVCQNMKSPTFLLLVGSLVDKL
jgi:hypothetical protein